MSKMAAVHKALMDRLEAEAAAISVEVAYPNVDFEPDSTKTWYIEANLFVNTPKAEGLKKGQVADQGLFSIAAVYPEGVGSIIPLGSAGLLRDMFPKDLKLFEQGFKVTVVAEPWIGSPLIEANRYIVPVTVEWVS